MQITLGEKIRAHLVNLIPSFGLNPSVDRILAVYDMLTFESLALDLSAPLPRFSTINNNGVPFEFSISMAQGGQGLRFLTEIGIPGTSLPNRINLNCTRLNGLLDYLDFGDSKENLNMVFRTLLPENQNDLKNWRGGVWIGAGFLPNGKTGLKIYVNAADSPKRDAWVSVCKLLANLGRMSAAEQLCSLAPLVSSAASPLGVAIDLLPNGVDRVKFYLRTTHYSTEYLDAIFSAVNLADSLPQWRAFQNCLLVEKKTFPDPAIVLSLEIPSNVEAGIDLKVDVCAHCLFANDVSALNACLDLTKKWSVDSALYQQMLLELASGHLSDTHLHHHSYIGIGFSHSKEPRLNIYLKPDISAYVNDPKETDLNKGVDFTYNEPIGLKNYNNKSENQIIGELNKSISSAVKYILDHQSRNGYFSDFLLPVGASDAWVTAYIGLALTKLPAPLVSSEVTDAIRRASYWSLHAMQSDFGWGYNAFTESDADSSAYNILFLSACNEKLPNACFDFLKSHQKQDGGFSTYIKSDPNDAWGLSHLDVTPIVLEALSINNSLDADGIASARKYIASNQNPEGIWQSYWWSTYLYSTWANLKLLEKNNWPYQSQQCLDFLNSQPLPKNAFCHSLYCSCLYLMKSNVQSEKSELLQAIHKLIQMQLPDGSWPSDRILRVTKNSCKAPWSDQNAGELYSDKQHLFTTATVLNSLITISKEVGLCGVYFKLSLKPPEQLPIG